jgi:hypothetical protein
MTVHEPMVMWTDYALAAAALYFAFALWRAAFRPWGLAFAFTALGTIAGGTYHGIGPMLHPQLDAAIWKLTVYAIGLASFFLLTGAAVTTTEGRLRRGLIFGALVKFGAYATWMITHEDFKWVILDYGVSLLVVGALFAAAWRTSPAAPWIVGSIAVAIVAACVQQARIGLSAQFDHNALYHVVQLLSLWMLYRGGLVVTTLATSRSTIPPT